MTKYYEGLIVPEKVQPDEEMSCHNSICHGVDCNECINFPTGLIKEVFDNYNREKNWDKFKEGEWT